MSKGSKRITIYLPEELIGRLTKVAELERRTISGEAQIAIERHLDARLANIKAAE